MIDLLMLLDNWAKVKITETGPSKGSMIQNSLNSYVDILF